MADVSLNQIRQIFLTMNKIGEQKMTKLFAYGLSKNKTKLQEDLTAIAEAEKVNNDFDVARVALCEKYATKGEDGKPLSENNNYVGLTGNKEFEDEFKILLDKYKPLIEENNALMNKVVSIDFYQIPFESIPEEVALSDFDILSVMFADPKTE